MYLEYFKLTCSPFDLAPDPRFLYITAQHSRAIANVRFALMQHDSFVVITGEIGTGKTTVLNAVLQELGPQYVTARLVHTTLTDIELLQSLLSEFGIPNYSARRSSCSTRCGRSSSSSTSRGGTSSSSWMKPST